MSVTYTALLRAHLQQQVKILLAVPSSNSRLSCYAEGDEVGQCRRRGPAMTKAEARAFALHLFEEVIRKKHSPLGFAVRQMFSGTSPANEALTLNAQ